MNELIHLQWLDTPAQLHIHMSFILGVQYCSDDGMRYQTIYSFLGLHMYPGMRNRK